MKKNKYKELVQGLLFSVGIEINGPNDWDIQVHEEEFYKRVLTQGVLGLGESYMDGWWDCKRLDEFSFKLLRGNIGNKVRTWNVALYYIKAKLFNNQKKSKAFEVGEKHYDVGNELYKKMLDKTMTYTCAYWKDSKNLMKHSWQN